MPEVFGASQTEMSVIELAVSQETLDENPVIAPGEPFVHGCYENAAGNTDEFLPAATDQCPLCYAKLHKFNVVESKRGGETDSHRPLLVVCPDCNHIPFKHEAIKLVPPREDAETPEI
ncbi:hypothetical protein [Haloarcula marismortui]|uniref:Uncharacterized protein n=1 Tax=Haloarcula marismortui ATCC 33799 TaxID=662475 RepID=M0KVD2_9EURY|nr:hypothetical protein [Haloarcula californiae]EMA24873.1 hypothetical protein C435_03233 [Haloarcula californiae ATCC 33799]